MHCALIKELSFLRKKVIFFVKKGHPFVDKEPDLALLLLCTCHDAQEGEGEDDGERQRVGELCSGIDSLFHDAL